MNVLVVGLGSMGKRRIRLIKEMYPEHHICGVDGRMDRVEEVEKEYNIKCYSSIDMAYDNNNIDCVFVCTSPLSHKDIIKEVLSKKSHVFTELNLVSDGYEDNITLAKGNGCVLFLSSTFFYREEIKYITNRVKNNCQWNYVYHVGQYLPDWHPWENYKDFFVGDKRTNGCREIMAIEFPWLCNAFGNVIDCKVVANNITTLNINFPDNYIIQMQHENGNKGVVVVDVVTPNAVRRFEAYRECDYIQWNGTPESLYQFKDDKLELVKLNENTEHQLGYREFIVENAYKNEIVEFFDVVAGKKKSLYGFEQDLKILDLIDRVENIDE